MNLEDAGGNLSSRPFHLLSREELKSLAWDRGMSDTQIAQMYGVSSNQVHGRRLQFNLVQGQMTASELSDVVRLAERVKTLPREAISEIREIVNRYTH